MGFGSFMDSTSIATDNRIAATDSAKALQRGATLSESGSILVGAKGKYSETGSTDLSNAKNNQFGGVSLAGAKDSSVVFNSTSSDPGVLEKALEANTKVFDKSLSALSSLKPTATPTYVDPQPNPNTLDKNIVFAWLAVATAAIFLLFIVKK